MEATTKKRSIGSTKTPTAALCKGRQRPERQKLLSPSAQPRERITAAFVAMEAEDEQQMQQQHH
jgi:hypothetical protein